MKKPLRITLVSLLVSSLIMLAGCNMTGSTTETTAATSAADLTQSLRQLYAQAAAYVQSAENFLATITYEKHTTVGTYTFTESSRQDFSYLHYGTDYMLADMQEAYRVGDRTVNITEHYDSGNCALLIDSSGFTTQLTPDAYIDRFAPLLLLDADLYESITTQTEDGMQILTFSQPVEAENWTGVDFHNVSAITGKAVLNADGRLVDTSYNITYTNGSATITLSVTVALNTDYVPTLLPFPDITKYTAISDPDIPKLLEQASGYVLQASAVTSSSDEKIVCNATGLMRTQSTALDMHRNGNDFKARLQRISQLVDYTQGGAATNLSQLELFLDNRYTIDKHGTTTSNNTIDAAYMLTYCQDTLVFPILLPKHITGMTVVEQGSTWVLEFDTTRELSDLIRDNAIASLYGQNNTNILDDMASSYEVNYTSGQLVLDKHTGLPLEATLRYSGTHTIAGYAYVLTYELTQAYDLTSQTAQDSILADALQKPSVPPTSDANATA